MTTLRQQISHRPLLLAFAGLCAGIAGRDFPALIVVFLGLLVLTWQIRPAIFAAVFFAFGAWIAPAAVKLLESPTLLTGEAKVTSAPVPGQFGRTFQVQMDGSRYRVTWTGSTALHRGDVLRIKARATPPIDPDRSKREGTAGTIRLDDASAVRAAEGSRIAASSEDFAEGMRRFVRDQIGGDEGAAVNALAFSDSSDLTPSLRSLLQDSGTLFLIAASGLHLFILEGIFRRVLMPHLVPKAIRWALFGTLAFLYCMATGFHAATVRASIMATLAGGAYLWNREYDALSALGLVGLIWVGWQPSQLLDPGFQMSMLAVAALVVGQGMTPGSAWVRDMTSSVWGWAGSTPIGAFWFKTVAWSGLIAPLVPLIVIGPLIVLGLAAWGLWSVSPSLSVPLVVAVRGGGELILAWLRLFRFLPASTVANVSGYYLAVLYGVFFVIALTRQRPMEASGQ